MVNKDVYIGHLVQYLEIQDMSSRTTGKYHPG